MAVGLVMAAACGRTAKVDAVISDAASSDVLVKVLKANSLEVIDTVKLDDSGKLAYELDIEKGQVEFVYLYRGDRRLASLLLQAGDKVEVVADTLGNYSVTGSQESAKLAQVESEYLAFLKKINSLNRDVDNAKTADQAIAVRQAMGQTYLEYYRDRVRYILANSRSMTVIPVLYQTMGENLPIFGQSTDAIHFKNLADSLELAYPESRHVKTLRYEAERRMGYLNMESLLNSAEQIGYPDIELPDINGKKRKLSDVDSKVIMIHFWTASKTEQKVFNLDVLKSLYKDFHHKGFEIYQVSLDVDNGLWARVMREQKLPWTNVSDISGGASRYVLAYNLTKIPSAFLIGGNGMSGAMITDAGSLSAAIEKALK